MLNLTRGGYAAGVVALALHAPWGSSQIDFRYDLLDRNLNFQRTLTNVRKDGNNVSMDALGDIKRKAKFSLVDDGTVDFMSDRIKPYALLWVPPGQLIRQYAYLSPWQISESDLQMSPASGGWVEFALGVFLLSTAEQSEESSGALIRSVEAYDQAIILKNDKTSGKYLIPMGTAFVDAIRQVLQSAGITNHNIAPSNKVLPFDREWDRSVAKLDIINDMLEALNYYSLWFDEEGLAIGSPYVLPADATSEYTYADDDRSVIARPVKRKQDTWSIPNRWVYYTSETAQTAPLWSTYTNDSPNSPLSTVNRGMTITESRQVEAPDQATLDALVKRSANDAVQVYDEVSWQSWILPHHSFMDNYTFTYSGMGISAKLREISWAMDLRADGVMQHTARRQVSLA